MDDLTRVRVNTIELTRLSDNLDDVIEKRGSERKSRESGRKEKRKRLDNQVRGEGGGGRKEEGGEKDRRRE